MFDLVIKLWFNLVKVIYQFRSSEMKELYPPIKPYNHGFLPVDGGHSVYWEECGNPKGFPVLFFHGGPGAGCSKKSRRYINPRLRAVLFDQRGCGRSQPVSCLTANTTRHLVQDIKKLLDQLSIKKVVLLGGSWGSTLAFVFAITYPEMVAGIVARGVYLGEDSEIDYSADGLMAQHFPEAWERFTRLLPPESKENPLKYFYENVLPMRDKKKKQKLLYEWTMFEDRHCSLKPLSDKMAKKEMAALKPKDIEAIATLEIYYIYNGCFLLPNFIINNVGRIPRHIPISLIHGCYDIVCPGTNAHRLHIALKEHNVRMNWDFSGHSASDPKMRKKIISEVNRVCREIRLGR